jgi:hypothetical protein
MKEHPDIIEKLKEVSNSEDCGTELKISYDEAKRLLKNYRKWRAKFTIKKYNDFKKLEKV